MQWRIDNKHMLWKRMETNMILTKLHDDNMYIIYESEDNVENKFNNVYFVILQLTNIM